MIWSKFNRIGNMKDLWYIVVNCMWCHYVRLYIDVLLETCEVDRNVAFSDEDEENLFDGEVHAISDVEEDVCCGGWCGRWSFE